MHKQDTHYNNIYYHNFKKPILEANSGSQKKQASCKLQEATFLGFKKQLLEILEANLGSQVLSQEAASQTGFSKMSFLESQGFWHFSG